MVPSVLYRYLGGVIPEWIALAALAAPSLSGLVDEVVAEL